MRDGHRTGRWSLGAGAIAGFVVGGLLVGLSVPTLSGDDRATPDTVGRATVDVGTGTVERSVQLSALPRWQLGTTIVNRRAGTVTSLDALGGLAPVATGDTLYSVDLRPTIVAVGTVPMFRELRVGTQGPDVAQLQRLLRSEGFDVDDDSEFGAGTQTAVENWQRQLGLDPTGVVALGDVVFVPQLPARLVVDPAVGVGTSIGDGATIASGYAAEPSFVVPIQPEQTALFAVGMTVSLGDPAIAATIAAIGQDDEGTHILTLGLSGPCSATCAALKPGDESSRLPTTIAVIPETTGVVVPAAAVRTDALGQPSVEVLGVGVVDVETGPAADGLVIILEGLSGGETIVVDP